MKLVALALLFLSAVILSYVIPSEKKPILQEEGNIVSQEPDTITTVSEDQKLVITIVLHPVRGEGSLATQRTNDNIMSVIKNAESIWDQANITFAVSLEETEIPPVYERRIQSQNWRPWLSTLPQDNAIHIYFLRHITGPNGIAFSPQYAVIADTTTVYDYRATAHEIGHLLGLSHVMHTDERLLSQGVNGMLLEPAEIEHARAVAPLFSP